MKIFRFLLALILTILFIFYVNFKQGDIPPLGKFMSPFTGFWKNGEKDRIDMPSKLKAKQLKEDVVIKFDDQVIPHIFAKNDYDLYFAQGYISAYHRLWQMEFQVMATEGRISEIIGAKALDFDKTNRRKGLKYAAERSIELMEKDANLNNMVQAYTDGINYWINSLSYEDYPIEYKLLDYAPEPWTKLKCALLLKYMADMLSSGEADLENTNALTLFGRADFELLFPESFRGVDPVIPTSRKWDFDPIPVQRPDVTFPQTLTPSTIAKPDPRNGSNNFVVGRGKSAHGKVMLANEPDLALNLPSIWYVTQLHAPGINTFGANLPGVPGIIVGFNDSIAWGVTNAKRDVVDWYQIEFRNSRREEYRYDNKWLKTEKVIEKIKVRDGSTVYDTIIHTHYGPVVYDRNFMGNGEQINFAMKWTAHEESQEFKAFYQLNRSKNYDQFVDAIQYFVAPAQNFAFASASGDIAMWVNGRFPIKWDEQGKFLMNGSDSRQEWAGDIPRNQSAYILNPEQGFVSSANQHPVDSTYPYYAYDYNYEFYRNRRINDRLKLMSGMEVGDMMKLQNDNYNYRASESLPLMLDSLDTANMSSKAQAAYNILRRWDYFNEPEMQAPSYYEAWWNDLYAMIWDEFVDREVALKKPHVFNTIYLMNRDPYNKYFDQVSTPQKESVTDLINQSFVSSLEKIEAWKTENENDQVNWYEYKNTTARHLLKLAPFSVEKIKIGGNNNIVNAASSGHGPSWRMVVELGPDQVRAWGVYPGSQSGNPGNPAYAEMIENWSVGKYYPLNFLKSEQEENANLVFTQTLKSN
ncbi:penicillin acylase family protein [Reichenbachiella agarivorans]|uniref:Penicillin acylase family protein n=1 Tax=Reichenbachiella agarivorans TaxID=2979464 RepID=A0ABY6CNN8_9BACT|nr:penicillin acylase family protein [Reichenbachiella agarivorans]UXP32133.1 penicillin acylase family protein [Reichenbachiella agarivorans]